MIEELLEFAEGPLFRASLVILVAGLIRRFVLLAVPAAEALYRANDRTLPWAKLRREMLGWLVPVEHVGRSRPVFTVVSFVFHVGLILVPLFAAAHLALWKSGTGLGWLMYLALPAPLAETLIATTVLGGLLLIVLRATNRAARQLGRASDYLILGLLLLPFVTGFVAGEFGGAARQWVLLAHVLSAEVVFVLIPFSRLGHCLLFFPARLARELGAKLVIPPPPPGYPRTMLDDVGAGHDPPVRGGGL